MSLVGIHLHRIRGASFAFLSTLAVLGIAGCESAARMEPAATKGTPAVASAPGSPESEPLNPRAFFARDDLELPPPILPIPRPGLDAPIVEYTDPYAFCAAAVTTDWSASWNPNATGPRWSGARWPFTEWSEFIASNYWRCFDGEPLICNAGVAGYPCAQVSVRTEPTDGVVKWCGDHPGARLPVGLTRHELYDWRCDGTAPRIFGYWATRSPAALDQYGFDRTVWHKPAPN